MLSVSLALLLFQALPPRPSVVLGAAEWPTRNIVIHYYDESYLFASRDYGSAPCNTAPGFFVHSNKYKRWMALAKISTANGHFGTSRPDDDPVSLKALSVTQVDWDYRGYATQPYIYPLLAPAGGFLSRPEHFTFDAASNRYELRYQSSWGIPAAETVLYIVKTDLDAAFDAATKETRGR